MFKRTSFPFLNFKSFEQPFNFECRIFWCVLVFFLFFRLLLSYFFPLLHDESYYWDWSRNLQLSYIDAPPFVAWLAFLGSNLVSGSLGVRFFLPFLHFFSVIFLLLSTRLLFQKKSDFKVKHALALCLLTECMPYFTLEGFLLLPDASLFFAVSGCVYFVLQSLILYQERLFKKSLFYGAWFGLFLGLGFLSKYQIAPLGLGFFIAFLLCSKISDWKFQLKYWITVGLIFAFVSSPVFIWNAQNDWASFRFQTQHGFQGSHFQLKTLFTYLIGVVFYLFPWYFYLFVKLVWTFFKQKNFYQKIELISILPFIFLFSLIFYAALGKKALPHWAMPGFVILTPVLVKNFFSLTAQHKNLWFKFHTTSVVLAVLLPILSCSSFLQVSVLNIANHFKIYLYDLEQISFWPNLQPLLKKEHSINIQTFPYSESQRAQCPNNTPYLASLRWDWASEIAFYFDQQPRVFTFASKNSYYSWRDDLSKFAGCRFIVVGSESHFNLESVEKILNVSLVQHVVLKQYPNTKIVVVHGIMR